MSIKEPQTEQAPMKQRKAKPPRQSTKPNYPLSVVAIVLFTVVFLLPFVFIVLTAAKSQTESALLDFSMPSNWQ